MNIPNCGKTVFVMGYNYERGLEEAVHSYTHRIESALTLTVGRGYWNGCGGHPTLGASDFDHFTCVNKEVTSTTPVAVAGCGSVHYPPNGLTDYDYVNSQSVQYACPSWYDYPFSTKTLKTSTCTEWSCTGSEYYKWWMGHIPRKAGKNANGNLNNWWKYIADFDNGVQEAKSDIV